MFLYTKYNVLAFMVGTWTYGRTLWQNSFHAGKIEIWVDSF